MQQRRINPVFSEEDYKTIKSLSKKDGMTMSTWIRHIVLKWIEKNKEKK